MLTLIALASAPGIAIALYVYLRDKYEREPIRLLILAFFLGVLAILPAILLETLGGYLGFNSQTHTLNTMIYAFAVVGLSEEFSKYFFVKKYLYPKSAFNEPFDGITYSVMVGMGFATAENIMYVMEGGMGVAIMRMFTAVPAHGAFGVMMGFFLGKAKFSKHPGKALLAALFVPTFFHGAYDFFLMAYIVPGLEAGALVSLVLAIFLSTKAIKIHQKGSPFRNGPEV